VKRVIKGQTHPNNSSLAAMNTISHEDVNPMCFTSSLRHFAGSNISQHASDITVCLAVYGSDVDLAAVPGLPESNLEPGGTNLHGSE
jgi:hypothetical protein